MSGLNFFEESLADYHKKLYRQELAFVQKIPDPVNIVKHLGHGKVIGQLTSSRWVDWGGYLDGGRAVWHESKETATASLSQGLFKKHQVPFLILAEQYGCLSFVTVRSKRTDTVYAVPASILYKMPLKWKELKPYALRGVRWYDLFFG